MFEIESSYMQCPRCSYRLHGSLKHGEAFACPGCRTEYDVLIGAQEGQAALLEKVESEAVLPLHLPRGSVRALIALSLLGSACFVAVTRGQVPESLLSLLLTIIGFYFGFRNAASARADRVHDPHFQREEPLFLPAGVIRKLMILAVAIMGIALSIQNPFWENQTYLSFFFSIAGLIIGHLFEKWISPGFSRSAGAMFKHLKALACLAVAGVLAVLFVSGGHEQTPGLIVFLLCGVVSFYYGSRS